MSGTGEEPAGAGGEAHGELARARSLAHQQSLLLDALLGRLEERDAGRDALQAARDRASCAVASSWWETRRHLVRSFTELLESPSWRIADALGELVRRPRRPSPPSIGSALRAACAALEREDASALCDLPSWLAGQLLRVDELQVLATRVIDGRRYRVGRAVTRLLPWLTRTRRPVHELGLLLRLARGQLTAARRALADGPPSHPGIRIGEP